MHLPCGGCVGCALAKARAWAVRCQLELQEHDAACWVTLTYDDAHLPHTLHKGHLQAWLKRLRAHFRGRRVRFFGCGEYGERRGRPHYHVILFGVAQREAFAIAEKWGMGGVQVDKLEPAAIAYVCGYQLKKAGQLSQRLTLGGRVDYFYTGPCAGEFLDKSTGELYKLRIDYQPPFLQMSRRPGIGGHARVHSQSWRTSAIWDGREVPVPRYLHKAWRDKATPDQLLKLMEEHESHRPQNWAEYRERARHLSQQAIINDAKRRDTLLKRSLA